MECPICFHIISNSCHSTCNHRFCYNCLMKWCKNGGIHCPLCKQRMYKIILDKLEGQPIEHAKFQGLGETYFHPEVDKFFSLFKEKFYKNVNKISATKKLCISEVLETTENESCPSPIIVYIATTEPVN